MRRIFLILFFSLPLVLCAQIGGERVYGFVSLPASSRATATGGTLITVKDKDVSLAFHNPSLLNSEMHNRFSAGTVIYPANIVFGNFNYARHYDSLGTFQTGIQYISYGKFQGTDVTGQEQGRFKAGEYLINVGGAYDIEKYTFGANVKFIVSQFERYDSYGGALDFAASYNDTSKKFTATIVIKNVGIQFKPYNSGNREPIPFELQAGFSKRFKHLPFRINVTFHDLQNFNIRYEDPNRQESSNFFSDDTTKSSSKVADVFDEIARHIIFGGELYFGKAVIIGFGYNHQRRQEMIFDTKKGIAGFSGGIVINIRQFSFGFSRARYHVAGASNHISVGINFNEWVKRKS